MKNIMKQTGYGDNSVITTSDGKMSLCDSLVIEKVKLILSF